MLKAILDRLMYSRRLRELVAAQRFELQFLAGRLKGAEDALNVYKVTNQRLNQELKAAEVRLEARVARYGE